jgi:hypothetical protein
MQSESEIKNSSSNMQDRSEVLSSEHSKNESDVDSEQTKTRKTKKNKELSIEDL